MPHSVFTGRVVEAGEPAFLVEDTDGAIALAEEERDTCPLCGGPRAWCRDPNNQFSFKVHEDQCHATYMLAAHRLAVADKRDEAQKASVQLATRFVDGKEPDLFAGLDLGDVADDEQHGADGS